MPPRLEAMAFCTDKTVTLPLRLELALSPWQPAHFDVYRALPDVGEAGVVGTPLPGIAGAPLLMAITALPSWLAATFNIIALVPFCVTVIAPEVTETETASMSASRPV